ncbi:hypothetical protein P7C73_g4874, partial [Tremellales sp. Uapishka_1]
MNTLGRLEAYFSSPPSYTVPTQAPRPTLSHRLSNLPPTPHPRRTLKRTHTPQPIKDHPPFLLRLVLTLWSVLLSFWRSLVGETRAERHLRRKRRGTVMRGIRKGALALDDSASEAEIGDWVDPVTRAPETDGSEDLVSESHKTPDPTFTFRLRSASKDPLIPIITPPSPIPSAFERLPT